MSELPNQAQPQHPRTIQGHSLLFCFVLGSVRLRPVRDTVRVLVCCYVRRYYIV